MIMDPHPGDFFRRLLALALPYLSDEHFTVDGTLIEAWASHKWLPRKAEPYRERATSPPRGARTRRTRPRPIPRRSCTAGRVGRKPGLPGPCAGGEPSGSDRGSHGHDRRWHRRGRCRPARGPRASAALHDTDLRPSKRKYYAHTVDSIPAGLNSNFIAAPDSTAGVGLVQVDRRGVGHGGTAARSRGIEPSQPGPLLPTAPQGRHPAPADRAAGGTNARGGALDRRTTRHAGYQGSRRPGLPVEKMFA